MKLNPDKFLENLYEKCDRLYYDPEKYDWNQWQQHARDIFRQSLGSFPEKTELDPVILEEKEFTDYIRQKVVYKSADMLKISAYVLIPRSQEGKNPAVIACHGHGYGNKAIVGLNPDGSDNKGEPDYQKNFAIELVKRGFLVIAPEILGFGERRLKEDVEQDNDNSCHPISTYLLMMGKTMSGMRVYDTIRTIDYLQNREDVDEDRIGCMGISGGGLVCSFTGAIEERIKVAVISGYSNTFKDSVMSVNHCVDNYVPGLVEHLEMPEIISLIAPRPLLIESGKQDSIFPIKGTKTAYKRIKEIYAYHQVPDKLDKDFFEGDHQISGKKAYDWFENWL